MELKLVAVARASLEELLLDYEDYLRQSNLSKWGKDDPKAVFIRKLAYKEDRSYMTYKTYLKDKSPETAANTVICLIHQTNYLLDALLKQLESQFIEEGGFTEKLHRVRTNARRRSSGS